MGSDVKGTCIAGSDVVRGSIPLLSTKAKAVPPTVRSSTRVLGWK